MKRFTATPWLGVMLLFIVLGCHSRQSDGGLSSMGAGTMALLSEHESGGTIVAHVRLINASSGRAEVEGYVDNLDVFSSVAFRAATAYVDIPYGEHMFHLGRIEPRQGGEDAIQGGSSGMNETTNPSEALTGGSFYTVVVLPSQTDESAPMSGALTAAPVISVLTDDIGSIPQDKAKLRVIHAAAGYEPVDIVAGASNDAIIQNAGFNGNASYVEINSMTTGLEVRKSGETSILVSLPVQTFEGGKAYTIVLTGSRVTNQSLGGMIVEDEVGAAHTRQGRSGQ